MDVKIDEGLKALLESGKEKGLGKFEGATAPLTDFPL